MSLRWLALAGVLLGLAACQIPFPRACFDGDDCERSPINGAIDGSIEGAARR